MSKYEITINNSSEITLEQLKELKENGTAFVIVDNGINRDRYRIDEFIKIKEKILEYISNIPQIQQDDPYKEKKLFTYIYMKVGENIEYDEQARSYLNLSGYALDRLSDYIDGASNLSGGLLYGKSMCKRL